MAYTKEIATGVGALACAIGIGFVMQSSETAEKRYGAQEAPVEQMMQAEIADTERMVDAETSTVATGSLLDVQEITLTSAQFDDDFELPATDAQVVKASAPASVLDTPVIPEVALAPETSCEISASAEPVAAAMVDLMLNAPCLPNERVTVHHNGMIITETTSTTGTVAITIPALAADAVFILAFTNGEGAVAQTRVEDISQFSRAVLQWKGNTGFQIHAREFGADYGDEGHLWHGAPGSIVGAVSGTHGVLTRHGDVEAADPLLAEVYTFPHEKAQRDGAVSLSVETEVTVANCGLEIEAQSLELQADGTVKTRNLSLPVPDCDGQDGFLVLNNLLEDLKVASK